MKCFLKIAVALVIGVNAPVNGAEFTLKFAHEVTNEHSWGKAILKFKELVEVESEGRIEVRVYPNSQLGKEMDVINSVQLGIIDMTLSGESLQNWAPKAALLAVPYMFRDAAHLHKVVNGEIGAEIEQQITERAGLVPLGYFARGGRNLTSNRPVRKPEDLNGIIVRVPNVPLFVDVWEALGAKPTPMAFGEVFTALQQNTIHAQENPLALIKSASFFEVQDYVNRTDHVRSWIYVLIGQRQLQVLPNELQQVVRDAAKQMQAFEHQMFAHDQKELESYLRDRGMTFVEVDMAAFMLRSKEAVMQALSSEQRVLYQEIQFVR